MTVLVPGADSGFPGDDPGPLRRPADPAVAVAGSALWVWTERTRDRCVLRLRGRLGAETIQILDGQVDRLGCRWCEEVVVDVARVEEIDQVGARLLVGLEHYVGARGGRFTLIGATMEVRARLAAAEIDLAGG